MLRSTIIHATFFCVVLSCQSQQPTQPASTSGQSTTPTPPVTLIPRSHDERERLYRAEHHIILNAVVTDESGKQVSGLKEKDFTLLDNEHPQSITSFRAIDEGIRVHPAHVILVLDAVNNSSRSIASDRREIEKYLQQSPELLANPTAILVLSGQGSRTGLLSTSRNALLSDLKALAQDLHPMDCADEANLNEAFLNVWMPGARPVGTSSSPLQSTRELDCQNQRFVRSISELYKFAKHEEDNPARVILIWLGPGWPLLTSHQFQSDNEAVRQSFFHHLVEISTALRESQVTLDQVAPPDIFRKTELLSDHESESLDGIPSAVRVTAGSLGLQVLAHQSGGQVEIAGKDIPSEIAKCINDAANYYALSFDSLPGATFGEFHSIRVMVKVPGLKVRTTTSYYAQP